MQSPDFRLATPRDAGLVQAISASAYIPAYQAVVGAVPRPAYEDYTDRILSGSVWVLELTGEVCGVLVLEDGPGFLLVYSVAVDPRHQGKGLGRALLAHAERCARSKNLPELRLYTNRRMTRNMVLYAGYGFVETGERPHPSRPGEVLVDMAKRVGDVEP
jgi:ribosomal protein S18 acetylase RimI-like enzyme